MLAPLSKLKKIFNLKDCEEKPYFPYLFNSQRNKDVVLPHLPNAEYYTPEKMKPDEQQKFYEWYEANKRTPFNLRKELHAYGENDTKILLGAIIEFRKLLMTEISDGLFHFALILTPYI
jgi:hypothetical protein